MCSMLRFTLTWMMPGHLHAAYAACIGAMAITGKFTDPIPNNQPLYGIFFIIFMFICSVFMSQVCFFDIPLIPFELVSLGAP